jgi:hypothetical protein
MRINELRFDCPTQDKDNHTGEYGNIGEIKDARADSVDADIEEIDDSPIKEPPVNDIPKPTANDKGCGPHLCTADCRLPKHEEEQACQHNHYHDSKKQESD